MEPPEDLSTLLGRAHQTLLAEMAGELRAAGYEELSPEQARVLEVLQAGGCTAAELGETLEVTQQAALHLAKELQRRGYVRRTAHPGGRGRVLCVLTEKALQHLRAAGYLRARLEMRLIERMGAEGLDDLRARLAQLGQDQP